MVNGLQGTLTVVDGESSSDTLNVDDTGSTGAKSGTLTATTLKGLGMGAGGITYDSYYALVALNISLGAGNNTLNIQSTNSQSVTTVSTGIGTNAINVGSLTPLANGIVDNISGALTVKGVGSGTTVNVDDTGQTGDRTGFLTATTLTGLGYTGGITYNGLVALNISLGSGEDTFYVQSTISGTVTTVSAGAGTDAIIVGRNALYNNGIANNIQGTLTVVGGGSGTTVDVNDTGSTGAKSGALTATALTGLGMGAGGVTYSGLAALNISLGSGGNTFTLNSTSAATVTTVNTGEGADTITLVGDNGPTKINAPNTGTNDTINIRSTGGLTTVNTSEGATSTINVGSLSPAAGGMVNGLQGTLAVVDGESSSDTLNVDDTGSTGAKSGTWRRPR